MTAFMGELVGTALLITFGDGVVANVVLNKTKGNNSGWIVINFGWAMAVFIAVYASASSSGAHLNPAITIAKAASGSFAWADVPMYFAAQMIGAMIGATLVWLIYKQHFDATEDAAAKLAVFCTGPAIRGATYNLLTEIIATCLFVTAVLFITHGKESLGSLDALPVALVALAMGTSLGGPTGYAINPARDLGPRIMHSILPISNKGTSDWEYSLVPVAGPVIGAFLAVWLHGIL